MATVFRSRAYSFDLDPCEFLLRLGLLSQMISISIKNLTKRFGAVSALQHLDLTIGPGELFFLLGPSGCGKTTLLRCLAGFYIPEEGTILFADEDVTKLPPHKRNTGMMFQSYALWPHLTVSENVAFGLEERKVGRAEIRRRVGEALESVRMGSFANRRPNELSGGQQQRIALARALVVRPRCLLLDEPLSNLDAKLRLEMRTEIRRVCKDFHLTTVYVTHDQKEALSISDRMAILDGGKILQVGTPGEIYRRPATRAVANFIGETDLISGRVTALNVNTVTVETALGAFEGIPCGAARRCALHAPVTLSIRPECWRLSDLLPAGNAVKGKIGESTYLGEVAQHEFVTTGGRLKILELNPRHLGSNTTSELFAGVAVEDVVVLEG